MNELIEAGLVSTIIPVYNRAELIVLSVQSVLEQDYRPIEIIIVDDGSTDATPLVLQELAAQHSEIQIITQSNQGPGSAREAGRRTAKGEFIQYHDSDDLLLPNKFSMQVAALQANREADVAYGKTKRRTLAAGFNNESLTGRALKGTGETHPALFPLCLRQRWWSTSTPLHRRSVTDKAGAWLNTLCEEDWEYDCRIASLGGRLTFIDTFVSITQAHDDHLSTGGTRDPIKLRHRCRAQSEIFKHAQRYMLLDDRVTDITVEDWQFYSKALFLLARECAAAGLVEHAKTMFELSLIANGAKSVQHKVFISLATVFGWRGAANVVSLIGR